MWRIYVFLWIVGLSLMTIWNLNHEFKWIESMDRVYGAAIGVIIFGNSLLIFYRCETNLRKCIAGFFLFLSLSNLSDELFYNPYTVNWFEYLTALGAIPFIIHYVSRIEKIRI